MFPERARWIWHRGESSPRNAWRCFRAAFDGVDATAVLTVTADSRYTVWVNGERVGHGPVRGFQRSYHVDSWPVGHLLRPDGPNVVAVLVQHFGVPTFSHPRGRAGMILAVTGERSGDLLVTDESWRSAEHGGHESRSSRISPQLAFTEVVDARWEPDWFRPDYEPSVSWTPVDVVGPEGTGPWTTLLPRDIPPLAESLMTPEAVLGIARTRAHQVGATIDARNHFMPETEDHADVVAYAGYVATTVELDVAATLELSLPFARSHHRVRALWLAGRWWDRDDLEHGHAMSRSLAAALPPGRHLLVIETALTDHGYPLNLQLSADTTVPRLSAPADVDAPSCFVGLGPVAVSPRSERTALAHPSVPVPALPEGARETAVAVLSGGLREPLGPELRAIGLAHVTPASVYGANVHSRSREAFATPVAATGFVTGADVDVPSQPGHDTEILLDLGREGSGYLELEVTAPEGTVLDLYGFEYARDDVREETIGCDNTLRYVARAGRQTYRSEVRRGLRYLQVTVRRPAERTPGESTRPVVFHRVGLVASHYPVSRSGAFECSDPALTDAWEMCRQTLVTCMEDTFVDCPVYEQAFWVGDSYSSSRFAAAMFDVGPLVERCLRLVARSAVQTPLLNSQVPSGWTNVIPSWTFLWAIACRDHWYRTADAAFARELVPQVAAALSAFDPYLDDDGLLSIDAWNFIDWAQLDQPNSGVVTHQNMMLILAWEAAGDLAEAAGDPRSASDYRDRAEKQRASVMAALWDDTERAYVDSIHADRARSAAFSQQTQLFALLAGAGDPDRLARLEDVVCEPPADWVQIASPWLAIFVYDALAARGRTADAVADLREKYSMMLDLGATTCWETYPGSTVSTPQRLTRSHCHAWSAAPAAFLPERVLGILPTAPGFRRVRIEPFAGDLAWARGRVPLPSGQTVDVAWTRGDDGVLDVTVTAPEGVQLELADGVRFTVHRTSAA